MSSPNRTVFGHISDLFSQGMSMFGTYKQMTPTRHQSTWSTLSYLHQNRNHTYHFLGFDTGMRDYGAQLIRNPRHLYNLYNMKNTFNETGNSMDKRIRTTMSDIKSNPVSRHGWDDC